MCDVIIILLPIPLLLRIKINTRKKVGLICVFTLGLFTTVCSIMRMVQIEIIAKNGNSTNLVLWGTVELNVGVSATPLLIYIHNPTNTARYRSSSRAFPPSRRW